MLMSLGTPLGDRAVPTGELWFCCYHDDGTSGDVGTCSDRFGNLFMGDGLFGYSRCVDGGITGCGSEFWSEAIGDHSGDVSTGALVIFDSGIILLVDDAACWCCDAVDVGGRGGHSISQGLSSDYVMGHAWCVSLFRLSVSL